MKRNLILLLFSVVLAFPFECTAKPLSIMADFYNPKVDKTTDKYVDRVYWFVMDLSFNKLMGLVPSLKHAVLLNDDKVHIARVVLISKLLKQNPNIDKVCQDAYWVSYHMKDVDQTGSLQNYNPRFKNVL